MRNFLLHSLTLILLLSPLPATQPSTLNALFIGNSYTARHHLAQTVEKFAEAGNPGLDFQPSTVIYGGRRLVDHWRLGTANFVRIADLTPAEIEITTASLEKTIAEDPKDNYAASPQTNDRDLLKNLESRRTQSQWDVVILQSYRDDLEAANSLYHQYAPRFTGIAKAQGARVLLYETTPTTQNAEPLTSPPDPTQVLDKARALAALADELDVAVAPMSLVALRCQEQRPDLTLRFIDDGHLNQVLSYLTACAMYAALFEKSPEGLPVDSVTDTRYFEKDGVTDKTRDLNGDPITRTFPDKDRAQLQRIAWQAWTEFQKMRTE